MKWVLVVATLAFGTKAARPLIVWHGVNDDCSGHAGRMAAHIRVKVKGIYIHCINMSDDLDTDYILSTRMDARKQLDIACANVNADPRLRGGFNAFGISQGGLFLRALVERCPPSKIHNFVTFSSPHQGIFGIPRCYDALPAILCGAFRRSLSRAAYTTTVQKRLTPAQYWHDPTKEELYRKRSTFIAVYNNERDYNESFKANLLKVNKLVLVRNTDDEIIVPRESAHFGYYREGQRSEIVNMTLTRLYKDDLIGLKTLHEDGRLVHQDIPGQHVAYSMAWLYGIIRDYFSE